MRKKGVIQVQFSWIFMLIAGAVIFAFFFSIVARQQAISDQKLTLGLLRDFDALATGASSAEGAAESLPIPDDGIRISCSDECSCSFSLGEIEEDFRDRLIFGPSLLEGSQAIFWSQDWNMPFKASNFLLIANRLSRVVLVVDDSSNSLASEIMSEIPEDLQGQKMIDFEVVESANLFDVERGGETSARFIFVGVDPTSYVDFLEDEFRRKELSISSIDSAGELRFYGDDENPQTVFGYSDFGRSNANLLAAVFAHDSNMYRCNMLEATRRLEYTTEVAIKRVDQLAGELTVQCSALEDSLNQNNLFGLRDAARDNRLDGEVNPNSFNIFASSINTRNEELKRLSCPLIY